MDVYESLMNGSTGTRNRKVDFRTREHSLSRGLHSVSAFLCVMVWFMVQAVIVIYVLKIHHNSKRQCLQTCGASKEICTTIMFLSRVFTTVDWGYFEQWGNFEQFYGKTFHH